MDQYSVFSTQFSAIVNWEVAYSVLHKSNKELFSICLAPFPQVQVHLKRFPTHGDGRTGLVQGLGGGGGAWLQLELNHA